MLRSMWSGVAGLKSQQEAMDVVGNNVANVNTVGFKRGRTNFVDVLSQTLSGATGPEGNLGGINPHQVGLGDSVAVVDNIFSQGSLQATDKITDLAIQGDGFFVVSGDGGKTYRYTRAGDFAFDAKGNLVNPEGYVVQGWLSNDTTHKINTAASIENLVIPQDKTVPAGITKNVAIKANLNGGDKITEMDYAHGLTDKNNKPATADDMAVLFDVNGNSINLGKTIATFAKGTDTITHYDTSGNFVGLHDIDGNNITLASSTSVFNMDITAGGKTHILSITYGTSYTTMSNLANDIKTEALNSGITLSCYFTPDGELKIVNNNGSNITIGNLRVSNDLNGYFAHALINLQGGAAQSETIAAGSSRTSQPLLKDSGDVIAISYDNGANYDSYRYVTSDSGAGKNDFHTIENLRQEMQYDVQGSGNGPGWSTNSTVTIDPNSGEIVVNNNDGTANHQIGAVYSNNIKFATIMGTLSGLVNSGSKVTSQPFMAAVHDTSIDVYDSLGNKHTVTFDFRKTSYDPTTKHTTWTWSATVPQPGDVSNNRGTVQFDETGQLVYLSSPLAITVDWKNGTASQVINLDFGSIGSFNGLTQFSLPSQTTSQTQDGYSGGSLQRILINQDGVIEGIFSNGKTYPLGQVAMAKFANDQGLMKEGGSMYSETANSGSALVGAAGIGGRGSFAPSHLEMSNVDLATAFTNMIIYERAFQANSRSITTSDQMIQELLNLKR